MLVPLPLRISFRIILPIFIKSLAWILIGIVLNLNINLERIAIFTMLSVPIHKHSMSLHLFGSSLISFIRICSFWQTDSVHALFRSYLSNSFSLA